MTWILNKNAILTGHVDSFCLACENHLRGDEDAVLHLVKPIHKKNLEATSFLDKYKDDRVRKVKKGYYCEYCNVFMKTATKVGPHVAEAMHCERRLLQPLKREGNGVLAFDKVFISESAWHGITEDTCSVCDAEFDNALLHKTETAHVLNLVLAEIEVADGNVYRKVDDSTFQCLTCNLVWARKDMTAHFDGPDHKKLYEECCDAAKKGNNEPKKETLEAVKEDNQNKESEKGAPKVETPKNDINEPKKGTPESVKEGNQNKKPEKEAPKDETPENVINEPKKETPESVKECNQNKKPEKEASKDETPKKPSESEISKEKTQKASEVANVKANDSKKKPEPKKNKKAASSAAKLDKMGKKDKEICEALGAEDYITVNVNGGKWCILCDWSMDQKSVQSHLNSKHHQTLLKMHRERAEKRNPESDEDPEGDDDELKCNEKSDETSKVDQKAESKSKIVDAAAELQKNNIKLDLINGSAYCRVCLKSVDYDFDIIKNHIDEHKKATKPEKAKKTENLKSFANSTEKTAISLVTSPVRINGKADKPKQEKEIESKQEKEPSRDPETEAETYAKENKLVYNKERNSAFCPVCITKVPPSLKNMKEHVNGTSHKNKVAQSKVKPIMRVLTKQPSHEFVNQLLSVENLFHRDFIINHKYCINLMSFLMMTKNGSKLRCQGCEMHLTASQIDSHNRTPRHESIINNAPVVTSEESEFIREIRPDVYHCGFCNQLESPWTTMESHLKSTAHREAKTAANWRLQSYAPDIAQHRDRRTMQFLMFHRMLMGQLFGDDDD